MKITNKLETPVQDPVVARGDILKVVRENDACYYLVGKRSDDRMRDVLTNLETGNLWTCDGVPTRSNLSRHIDCLTTIGTAEITHIPSNKVELVIGG